MNEKALWRAEIRARAGKRPRLEPEERPWITGEADNCVICDAETRHWLHPENAPLCPGNVCLDEYLKDPSVWDPRGLHIKKTKALPPVWVARWTKIIEEM